MIQSKRNTTYNRNRVSHGMQHKSHSWTFYLNQKVIPRFFDLNQNKFSNYEL